MQAGVDRSNRGTITQIWNTDVLCSATVSTLIAHPTSRQGMPLNINIENGVNGSGNTTDNQASPPPGFTPVGDSNGIIPSVKALEELDETTLVRQLENLQGLLRVENRIKDGAENLLNMSLDEALRVQVESELQMARKKIAAIAQNIENHTTVISRMKKSSASDARKLTGGSKSSKEDGDTPVDDFGTALQNATSCLKVLVSLSRSVSSPAPTSPSSSTSSSANNEEQTTATRIEVMSRLITILQRNVRVRYEINTGELVQAVLPCLADKSTKYCRAIGYRLIRHALIDMESVDRLRAQPVQYYIIKTLIRDNKHAVEKEQAIKLLRTIIQIAGENQTPNSSGTLNAVLSEAVLRAFIAVAEHAEDPFRPICIQTLAEILLIDMELMARCGGIRVLLHALAEGPPEVTPLLASVFLHIVDSPTTRSYLSPGTDLEIALSGVTDAYGKGPEHSDRMRGCARVIAMMLRTWSGLIYFCMNDMSAIRTVIDTLRIPSLQTREIVLDMFFDLLNIKPPDWYQTFIDGRRLTMYRKSRPATITSNHSKESDVPPKPQASLKLTDQYIALLIRIFTSAGLLDALSAMCEESITGTNLSRKATLLMAEMLHIANKVLPLSVASKIQSIPHIFSLAADYKDGEHRIIGTSVLSAIDSFNRNRAKLQPTNVKESRPRANSVEDAVRRGQRQVEQARIRMGMQMDDKTFQGSLLETQVMLTKDHTKWNFDILLDVVEGPLLNPKRMEEAIKVSRFIRRLMSFYHPFNHRFSDLPRIKSNMKWVKLGCALLTTLLSTPDGIRFLSAEDPFLTQIVSSFAQLDPFNGLPPSDPILSKKRIAETLTYGYLEMLGTLSNHKEGIEQLEKFKIFTAFYHLSELKSREDLIKGIIENLDYSMHVLNTFPPLLSHLFISDGHPRIVLSKALTSSYKHIRSYATSHLGELVRGSPQANSWTLRLLLTQLYDPAMEVRELAIHFLQEACESMDVLQIVVEMQPTLDHLGEIGHPLLLKFMSTPVGFRYLYSADYIDREMEVWLNERNVHYVVEIEVFLARAFNFNFTATERDDDISAFDGIVPPHFYGVMAKTELGCQVLQQKGHFGEFSQFIKKHGLEQEDSDLILKLKSVLWAVGNIGATEGGIPFLEEEEIIPEILTIAEQSLILSVRGTCFFVLGLISSTPQGAEILEDYGWEATLSPLGLPTGLCIPACIDKFLSIPAWTSKPIQETEFRLKPPTNETELELMTAISNLANTVIANTASRSLAKMKGRPDYRSMFNSPVVFYRILHTISTQKYRLLVRRYIFDLFNVEISPETVRVFMECTKTLRMAPSGEAPPNTQKVPRVISIFSHQMMDSDDSDADEEISELQGNTRRYNSSKRPVSLRPSRKIVGFDGK